MGRTSCAAPGSSITSDKQLDYFAYFSSKIAIYFYRRVGLSCEGVASVDAKHHYSMEMG